jgi:hypothetical protein
MEMKFGWKMMSMLVLVLLFAFVAACSQKKDEAQSQQQAPAQEEQVAQDQAVVEEEQKQEQEAEPAAEGVDQTAEGEESQDQMVEISGTLVQTEDGVGLFSDSGNYLLDQDLSDMVGQNVKVTGVLEEVDGKPVFAVSSISTVE